MIEPGFISAFAPSLSAYVEFKKTMGFYGASRMWNLTNFDSYCFERSLDLFDKETVEGYITHRLTTRSSKCRSWFSYFRDFGRWWQLNGNSQAYVLSDKWKAGLHRAAPYLFTNTQIQLFFAAAGKLRTQCPWGWQATSFFALMHTLGLRTIEVRRLSCRSVDLTEGHIDIEWSKGHRSRRLPLTPEIASLLAACDRKNASVMAAPRDTFFISATGNPIPAASPGVWFNRVWDLARLKRPANGKQPRPYDFRHHFAYANIEKWMQEGRDVNAMRACKLVCVRGGREGLPEKCLLFWKRYLIWLFLRMRLLID